MDDENLNRLPSLSDSGSGSGKGKTHYGYGGIDAQPTNSEHKEDMLSRERVGHKGDADFEGTCCLSGANLTKDYVDNQSLMETEDTVSLPVSIKTGCKSENNQKFGTAGTQPSDSLDEDNKMENDIPGQTEDYIQPKGAHWLLEVNHGKDLADSQPTMQVNFELIETVISEEQKCSNSRVITENGCQALRDESPNRSHSRSCILY